MVVKHQRILGAAIGGLLALIICFAPAAQATNWQQVAVSQSGDQRQYIDTDSITRSGRFVTVESYMEVSKASGIEIETYHTEYDCDRNLYHDIQPNEPSSEIDWQSLEGDPLNKAAQVSACSM